MRGSALAVSLLVLAVSGTASAQPEVDMDPNPTPPTQPPAKPEEPPPAPTKDPAEAKKALAQAAQLVQQGDYLKRVKPDDAKAKYEAAAVAYTHAIQNSDDLSIYVQLGGVLEKLDDAPKAVSAYRVVVKADAATVKPAVQAQAKKRIDDLMAKLGSVTLTVVPDETTISLDGNELAKTPMTDPLVFKPGTYKLALASVGYVDKEVEIQVEAGGEVEKKIELDPIPVPVHVTKPIVETPTEKPKPVLPPSKLPLYVGAGATGLGLVVTIAAGGLALHDHSVFVGGSSSNDDRFDAKINGRRAAIVSDVALAGTVAAAGFTAGWYFFKYRKSPDKPRDDSRNPNAPKIDLIPWVEPDGGGLAAVGAF